MRRLRWVGGAVALAALGGAAVLVSRPAGGSARAAARVPAPSTAPVQRRDLSAVTSQSGTLTYRGQRDGSPYTVINPAAGTYTELPRLGRVVAPGRILYRVDNHPVVLLRGATPAYRSLVPGARGPDVAQLNADLVSLGYAARSSVRAQPAVFGAGTAAAIRRLQAALAMRRTGRLTYGQVVFTPTAVRVTNVPVALGGRAQPGAPVLQGTSTTRQVQLALSAAQQATLNIGDRVSITLPDSRTIAGVVSSVGAVATCASSAGTGAPGSAAAPRTDSCDSGGASPTVPVGVTPADPAACRRWDQAPVQVGIATATVRDALVVPVTALVARAGGGYAVEVVAMGGGRRLAPVSPGLFDDADGLVQIAAPGLRPGQRVVVPST